MGPAKVSQQLKNHLAGPEIQVAGRLIGKQYTGLSHKGACQHDTLLFSARQFTRAVQSPRAKADFIQPRERFGGSLRVCPPPNQ